MIYAAFSIGTVIPSAVRSSVRLSVCLSQADIVTKRITLGSCVLHQGIALSSVW